MKILQDIMVENFLLIKDTLGKLIIIINKILLLLL
jgi:hypothetical protein